MPYYKVKLAVEELVAGEAAHWTILRATQFHDLLRTVADVLAKSPVVPVFARTKVQPVAVEDVAVRVADLAEAPPVQGRAPDFGGPEVRPMGEFFRIRLQSRGKHRLLLPVWIPGRLGRGLRAGYGTPARITPTATCRSPRRTAWGCPASGGSAPRCAACA